MRQLFHCAAAVALLVGCTDGTGVPTDQGPHAKPDMNGAEVIPSDVSFMVTNATLAILVGMNGDVTPADVCAGNVTNSPNSHALVVLPPPGGFLAGHGHGQDVPILVYEYTGDLCDGVGETLIASGTGSFEISTIAPINGNFMGAGAVRATLDLVSGGQARLFIQGPTYILADGSVKFDKTRIIFTPL
jgi:hypothetical protein